MGSSVDRREPCQHGERRRALRRHFECGACRKRRADRVVGIGGAGPAAGCCAWTAVHRRRWSVDHAGIDRLPHAPGLWRESRGRVRATALRRELRRDCTHRRRHSSHGECDAGCHDERVAELGVGAVETLDGGRRDHHRDQVGLWAGACRRATLARGCVRAGPRPAGHDQENVSWFACFAGRIHGPAARIR